MPKGKKFDAAQKHFSEKELTYKKQITGYTDRLTQYNREICELKTDNEKLSQENAQMKEWIERLLQYTELSTSDIKQAREKDKAIAGMLGLFKTIGKYM